MGKCGVCRIHKCVCVRGLREMDEKVGAGKVGLSWLIFWYRLTERCAKGCFLGVKLGQARLSAQAQGKIFSRLNQHYFILKFLNSNFFAGKEWALKDQKCLFILYFGFFQTCSTWTSTFMFEILFINHILHANICSFILNIFIVK